MAFLSKPCVGAVLTAAVLAFATSSSARAQFTTKWLSGGSLQDEYSEVAAEDGGLRWPGLYQFATNRSEWRSMWVAATDHTDEFGDTYPYRVVHAGPRVTGVGEMFPTEFELVSKHPATEVYVDGFLSESFAPMDIDRVDPSIPADFMIVNRINTLLGITVERRIMQFSQEYHDNYHVIEYTLTNTGNTDFDEEVELPGQAAEGVYLFVQSRWRITQETRYVIGNATGWGINTMVDIWGDGEQDNLPEPGIPLRASYAWHGYFPGKDVSYNNLGGPVLPEGLPASGIADTDTLGRLGSYQFVGTVTMHADASPTEPVDDPNQPSTTTWLGNDDPYQSNNDAFNPLQMETEYGIISAGRKLPAHAYAVEPGGMDAWLNPSAAPALGTPGGYNGSIGLGPYTLAPGESVRIVTADAVDGLSREAANAIGRAYKLSGASESAPISYDVGGEELSMTKNEWVFTGRDSLYHTFLRAMANYESGYAIPPPPPPPTTFNVNSGGDRITLSWDYPADASPSPDRILLYRAANAFDSTYTLIHEAGPAETSFEDTTPIRGINYYYYMVAVADGNTDDTGRTPTGVPLQSNRYATQTYVAANLKRPPGDELSEVRIVPNPFNLGSSTQVRWPDQTDKLGFLNIPGRARIEIFTELGELVDVINHEDGSGDAYWNHTTSSGQIVASGIYFAVITDTETGGRAIKKFVIIR
jgi:hypothetical protein